LISTFRANLKWIGRKWVSIKGGLGKKVLTAYERALEEGETEKVLETARKMLEEEDSIEKIILITGLSEAQLRENGIL
jgi:hypothetical protein